MTRRAVACDSGQLENSDAGLDEIWPSVLSQVMEFALKFLGV
jgi:hypothetical protein